MAIVSSSNLPSIAQRDLSNVFLNKYRDIPSMLPLIYSFKKAEQGTEYDLEMGDIPAVGEFDGSVSYPSFAEGYKQGVSETEYAQGLQLTRRLMRNDLYGAVRNRTGLLAQNFRHLRETVGASAFVNGFSSFRTGDRK